MGLPVAFLRQVRARVPVREGSRAQFGTLFGRSWINFPRDGLPPSEGSGTIGMSSVPAFGTMYHESTHAYLPIPMIQPF